MTLYGWITNNYIEVFGAIAGIVYVFLEIRQSILLWPVGILTSAVYIWVFFTSKLYADMSLQGYYLVISFLGWYWWVKGTVHKGLDAGEKTEKKEILQVTRLKLFTGVILGIIFVILYAIMWFLLSLYTDSPVPQWDSFITSLSIVATWMLARKIYEHWFLWIVINFVAVVLFITRGLYPTVVLYLVYGIMSFAGLREWKISIKDDLFKVNNER